MDAPVSNRSVTASSVATNKPANAELPSGQSKAASSAPLPTVRSNGDSQTTTAMLPNPNRLAAVSAMPTMRTGSSVQQTSAAGVPSAQIDFGGISESIYQISLEVRGINDQLLGILQHSKGYAVPDPNLRVEIANFEADVRKMQTDVSLLAQRAEGAALRAADFDSRVNTGRLPQSKGVTSLPNIPNNPPKTSSPTGEKKGLNSKVGVPSGRSSPPKPLPPPPLSLQAVPSNKDATPPIEQPVGKDDMSDQDIDSDWDDDDVDLWNDAKEVSSSSNTLTSSTPNGYSAPTGSKSDTSYMMSGYGFGPQADTSAPSGGGGKISSKAPIPNVGSAK